MRLFNHGREYGLVELVLLSAAVAAILIGIFGSWL